MGRAFAVALTAVFIAVLAPTPAEADFGVASFTAIASNRDGTPNFQAGSHPYEYTLGLTINPSSQGEPEASLRTLILNLPAGLVGNPLAVPRCTSQEFEGTTPRCAPSTQIGIAHLQIAGVPGGTVFPIYNVEAPAGVVASFGLASGSFEQAFLRTGGDYGLTAIVAPVPVEGVETISETIWGVPADPGHDAERVCFGPGGQRTEGCASSAPLAPFLTLPGSCTGPLETTVVAESLLEPGIAVGGRTVSVDTGGNPTGLAGCEGLPFAPTVAVQAEGSSSDSPTGLSIDLQLPQTQGAKALATTSLKGAVFELPEGFAIDPPVAAGLGACSPAQVGLRSAPGQSPVEFTPAAAQCPDAAKVGEVELETPLVDHGLSGGVYLATPHENPFGALLAVYIVVNDRQSGVVLKLPAQLEADPGSGRLTLRVEEAPQLPFEDLKLSFPEGPRAVFRTPPVCGVGRVASRLTPWSEPAGRDVELTGSMRTSVAAGGAGACPLTETQAPNAPNITAEALAPAAGAYSPFVLRVARADGTQRLAALDTTLPAGLTAKLAGVPYCGQAEIAAATCPAASEVGSVNVAAGAGSLPLQFRGRAHLAGPYRGAPLSLAIVVPAVAGPFDLGAVVVRVALQVDPRSARVDAVSDPLPTILEGIPLDIRSIAVNLNRPGFALNPTFCEPTSIAAIVTSTTGARAGFGEPFRVRNCTGLGFRPKAAVSLIGPTHRGAHPALRAVVTGRRGDSNLRRVALALPGTELLENRHIGTVCSRAQFAAEACPPDSVHGEAKVFSPLLGRPLQGPVYLRESNHRLPDLVAALHGQIDLDLVGHISSRHARLQATFTALPDAPLSKVVLTLEGGDKGLLANTGGLCAGAPRAGVRFAGQNGRVHAVAPALKTACGKTGP